MHHSQKKQLIPLYIFISESVELSSYSWIVGLDVDIQLSELFLLRVMDNESANHIFLRVCIGMIILHMCSFPAQGSDIVKQLQKLFIIDVP